MVLLTACGAGAQVSPSGERSAGASVAAEASVDAAPSASSPPEAGELRARPSGSADSAPLGYLEYLPRGYGDGDLRPLLVFLHGSGEAGDGSEETLDRVAKLGIPQLVADGDWLDDQPFVVLAPQYGTEYAEDDCAIADEISAFLDFAIEQYVVDPARVYLTGISCGAIGIWDYLAGYGGEVVAATVPISGHAEWALEEVGCAPLTEVPVWAFHGAVDETVPVVHIEGPMEQLRGCDGAEPSKMQLTVYPDADHDAWTRTYDLSAGNDIYAWMLQHTNQSAE